MEKSWLINFVKFIYFITQISLSFRGFFFPYFCNKYSNESCLQTFYDIEREKDCAITNLIHANILIWAKLNEIIQQAQISFSGNNWYSTFIVLFFFFHYYLVFISGGSIIFDVMCVLRLFGLAHGCASALTHPHHKLHTFSYIRISIIIIPTEYEFFQPFFLFLVRFLRLLPPNLHSADLISNECLTWNCINVTFHAIVTDYLLLLYL